MVETTTAVIGALVAGEVTGVTNITGAVGGGTEEETPNNSGGVGGQIPPGLLGGGAGRMGEGVRTALQTAVSAAQSGGGTTVIRDAQAGAGAVQETVEKVTKVVQVPSKNTDTTTTETTDTSGGTIPFAYRSESPGGTDYTLQESPRSWVRDLGEAGQATGEGTNALFSGVNDFVEGVGSAPDAVDGFGKEVGYNLFNTSEEEIEAIKSGEKKSPGQKFVDSVTGAVSGIQAPTAENTGSDNDTETAADSPGRSPDRDTGTNTPDSGGERGGRTRTVTVPSESADQQSTDSNNQSTYSRSAATVGNGNDGGEIETDPIPFSGLRG